jgi:hypothetical protein
VRRYGYGVPEFGRALLSTRNDLTSLVEDGLQPFQRDGSPVCKPPRIGTGELHLIVSPR